MAEDYPLGDDVVQNLSKAICFPTISHTKSEKFDVDAFQGFHEHLEKSYPLIHQTLKKEEVGEFALLYTWPASDQSLKPILLMAHQDVVGIEDEKEWEHPPFSGAVVDGYIWGRGTLDVKMWSVGDNGSSGMAAAERL